MQKITAFARKPDGSLMTAGTGTFQVYAAGTTSPVTIYSTDSLAGGAPSSTIPVSGKIEFYARNGRIKIVATEGSATVTVDDVVVNAGNSSGLIASRPSAGSADRFYFATDTGVMYRDNGTSWEKYPDHDLSPIGAADLGSTAAGGMPMLNGKIVASVASSALTIALKTLAGSDPSAADPVWLFFRSPTADDGTYVPVEVTSAVSFTVSNGSTLGVGANSSAFRLWAVAFYDTATVRLGLINCLATSAGAGAGRNADSIYPLSGHMVASSTAEGGAGAADSAQVFYTGVAVSSKAVSVLAHVSWETGLASIGVWSAAPTRVTQFRPGVALPGQVIQSQRTATGAVATGTTTIPDDDTIPQITEGDQYLSQAITPTSAANVLRTAALAHVAHSASQEISMGLFQDATANALAASRNRVTAINQMEPISVFSQILAALTAATTLRVRIGANGAGTLTFNGQSAARKLGGVLASHITVDEVMA